jgi:hypothetical protein
MTHIHLYTYLVFEPWEAEVVRSAVVTSGMYVCMCVCVYVCMYVCMYVMYVCMYSTYCLLPMLILILYTIHPLYPLYPLYPLSVVTASNGSGSRTLTKTSRYYHNYMLYVIVL